MILIQLNLNKAQVSNAIKAQPNQRIQKPLIHAKLEYVNPVKSGGNAKFEWSNRI
jgi:hypothetical protein